jgi:peptide/nickel transport system permease protein
MRKHILPYIAGYLLVYGSMSLGGAIIAIAGLSFLGLGIDAPTPEWGRAVNAGQQYVASQSWHISLIPGVMITLVVMGFNAMGDALRDAVDPKSDDGSASSTEADARGGGA